MFTNSLHKFLDEIFKTISKDFSETFQTIDGKLGRSRILLQINSEKVLIGKSTFGRMEAMEVNDSTLSDIEIIILKSDLQMMIQGKSTVLQLIENGSLFVKGSVSMFEMTLFILNLFIHIAIHSEKIQSSWNRYSNSKGKAYEWL